MSSASELRSAALISACTLLSRVLGLARDVLLTSLFKTGVVTDSFFLAFMIPNLFRRLLGEGAFTAAFLPLFTDRLERHGRERAFTALNLALTALTVILSVLLLLGYAGTLAVPWLVKAGAVPSATEDKLAVAIPLLWIMLPFLLLICLTAFLSGALNALNHFLAPALSSVVLNVIWIASLYFLCPLFGTDDALRIRGAAWGVLIGGVVQLALQVVPLAARGVRFRWLLDWGHEDLRELLRLFLPMVLGLAVVQVNALLDQVIAYFLVDEGANTALYLANRVMEFPLAIVGISLATAAFPVFATLAARDDRAGLAAALTRSLRSCFFLAVPASAGVALLAGPLTDLFFGWGRFDPRVGTRTAAALVMFGFGVWSYSACHIVTRAYYALQETRAPVRIASGLVALNLALNLVLVWPLREAGLALATSLCSVLNLILLLRGLRDRLPELSGRMLGTDLLRGAALSAVMTAACWTVREALPVPPGVRGGPLLAWRLAAVFAPVLAGLAVYLALAFAFRREEARDFLRSLRRR